MIADIYAQSHSEAIPPWLRKCCFWKKAWDRREHSDLSSLPKKPTRIPALSPPS